MLSPNHARPQQSARRAYVCLSCRLHNPRHHFATTASDRSSSPSKAQNTSSRFAKPHLAALPSDQGIRRRILVNTDKHVLKFKKGQSWGQLVRGHYSKQETFTNPTERETNGSEGEREDRLELALAQHAAEPRRVTIHGREGKTEAVANTLRSGCVRIHKIETPPARLSSSSFSMSHQTSSQFDSSRKRPTVYSTSRQDGLYKNSRAYHQQTVDSTPTANDLTPPLAASSIRAKLRQWQNDHGKAMEELYKDKMPLAEDTGAELNDSLTRLGDSSKVRRQVDDDRDEQHAIAHFARAQAEDLEDDVTDPRFLNMGDLVEIEYAMSEKDSTLAIYVRRMGGLGQFYTINGRWIHVPERTVQYSIPGWVSPELVKPLLEYLPDIEQLEDMDALQQEAYVNDLSVPRTVAAPLVSRLVAFNRESLEIYRKHASTLDRAHDILAHKEDLRYGSLVSAATTLLRTTSDKLPLTALFTVRKALMNAGFAFNVDRRSHRVTGYLQIRSKEQVRMVEEVRGWLREWQDDLAATSLMTSSQRQRHVPSKGAAAVNMFIEHAKAIVTASRQNREITTFGNIGPSKVKHEITEEQDAVKIQTDTRFNRTDTELVRFMEAWACSNMFLGLPRINALPPLILQATGLYEDLTLNAECGYIFLQELGTILPYENRVRFDQHLLLPSSQHSKPLQLLMNRVMDMRKEPDFSDSMKDIRYDWGGLPVYCIDGASAQEIDDGLSVQRANHADSVHPEWWVHIHIANPTAFFDRDHPLAKMARHMGETIYTPERTYMMLPRWATQRYFSLAKDRPCLTFSARLNARGEVLENKIRAGTIRNVHRLTYEEVNQLVGLQRVQEQSAIDITVGGTPPPGKERVSAVPEMKQNNIDDLQTLQMLAERRQEVRKASGGVFFDSHRPEMTVWQSLRNNGLAWDHPHRKGARTVEGDPIINMKTEGLTNWFAAGDGVTDILVREMMLLACNVSTEWCAQRQIPSIYRGSVAKPGVSDPAKFYEEVCQPAMAKNNGEMPLHIGVEYIKTQGSVILSTKPLRHNLLGLDHYGKVTSPLRRYGDMILHWQIEAALREEAKTGISLFGASTTLSGKGPDRSFLPFSSDALQAIMLGLQPREGMITRAKFYAEHFWIAMLMFRAYHFGEAKLPFETCHTYIATKPTPQTVNVMAIFEEINVACEMLRPERLGMGLPEARAGDRWECTLEEVNVFRRSISLRPVRLVSRWE